MNRPRYIWAAFAVCLVVVTGGMTWLTVAVLRLERAEFRAVVQSENERLALWRMDSALLGILSRESSRSYAQWQDLPTPAGGASTHVLLRFQLAPGGQLTSSEVAGAGKSKQPEQDGGAPQQLEVDAERFERLRKLLSPAALAAALRGNSPRSGASTQPAPPIAAMQNTVQVPFGQGSFGNQAQRSLNEFERRQANFQQNLALPNRDVLKLLGPVEVDPMKALWCGEELILARRILAGGEEYFQGCLLDWPAIRAQLLSEMADLLPEAQLVPVESTPPAAEPLLLAAAPVRLVPGDAPMEPLETWTPMQLALLIAWGCLILAAAAVAGLLAATLALSQRRAAFVSAVTHELRTPLTTFRMYTEMLAEGLVSGNEQRDRYVNTLRVEAERLDHLVENVLSYARLEGPKPPIVRDRVNLDDLLGRLRDPLLRRAGRAEMELHIHTDGDPPIVTADAAAVERIVLNLVDNACKYAWQASERRIEIHCRRDGPVGRLRVRDHGPGVRPEQADRLFRPFSKSAREAADSAPGIGLGLALSRKLARTMGGDLEVDRQVRDGACFVLTLPAAVDPSQPAPCNF